MIEIVEQLALWNEMLNIATVLDKTVLSKMGNRVVTDYNIDEESRSDWKELVSDALKLARQVKEVKTYAGDDVSNVKYPIIASAAIQFAARAFPSVVDGRAVVKSKVVGNDAMGQKAAKGERVAQHMNFQILDQMDGWETGMDTMLACLPITGLYYKKVYNCKTEGTNNADILSPDELVVNYWAKSLKRDRATHIVELTPNEIVERINAGEYVDFKYSTPSDSDKADPSDEDAPHRFLEQHTWWDLDEDGYKEPYVITVHEATETVVRVVARWDSDGIVKNALGKLIKIKPVVYFVKYGFMPPLDGSWYNTGFGILLGPLNSTINTLINQLIDAGTLSNRQSGFIGNGIKLGKDQHLKFKAGEWKKIQVMGDDLRKNIFALPVREPSAVLLKLLDIIMMGAKDLASQTDLLSGEQRQHNVPATTTLALIEQGLKVFTAVYKRIYTSLKEELILIRRLNKLYLEDETYNAILDGEQMFSAYDDYNDEFFDIIPVSDAAEVTDMQRLAKAEALKEFVGAGVLDDKKVTARILEAMSIPDIPSLFPEQERTDPKLELEMKKLQIDERKVGVDEARLQLESQKAQMELVEKFAKVMKTNEDAFKAHAAGIKALAEAEATELGPQLQELQAQSELMQQIISEQSNLLMGVLSGNQQGRFREMAGGPGNAESIPDPQGQVGGY